MRKFLVTVLGAVALMGIAGLALAAGEAGGAELASRPKLDAAALGLSIIGAALGMGIAAAGGGIGQGFGLRGACDGIAGKIQVSLILGLAFVESLAIYSLVVNLIILFANPFA